MESNVHLDMVRTLVVEWKKLRAGVLQKNELDYDGFKKTFAETYALLRDCTKDAMIDKNMMPLIVNAYCFANASDTVKDNKILAVFVLTERMLQHCTLDADTHTPRDSVAVYSLANREELYIDFTEVDQSVRILVEAYEKTYWGNR